MTSHIKSRRISFDGAYPSAKNTGFAWDNASIVWGDPIGDPERKRLAKKKAAQKSLAKAKKLKEGKDGRHAMVLKDKV